MYRVMSSYVVGGGATNPADLYTFGDETRLKLQAYLDNNLNIDPDLEVTHPQFNLETNESINTAWRYAVDTDKDNTPDTYTIYGIFFRSPPRKPDGDFTRARKPLEARTPPMSTGSLKKGCEGAAGTSASLVGDSGWYKIDGRLKKSFFVYTVNVPMPGFKGTPSVSALEYQQDQSRIPLSNNAVVYEDDLEISPGPSLKLNGRMMTNSNLLVTVTRTSGEKLDLYQVSSKDSCFYEQENSKIIVGGNVVNGWSGNNDTQFKIAVPVHLFKKGDNADYPKTNLTISTTNQSTSNSSLDVIYNNQAFADRIAALVRERIGPPGNETSPLTDPISVQNAQLNVAGSPGQTREQALEEYFKQRTRKVPFSEVKFGENGVQGVTQTLEVNTGEGLRPITKWAKPEDTTTKLNLTAGQLEAQNPERSPEEETYIGDRVVAGNNLPSLLWDNAKNQFVSASQTLGKWKDDGTDRTRSSQVTQLADVGATDRNGFWEKTSAQIPKTPLDGIGGLRIITSAGVYDRTTSFLPPPRWVDLRDTAGSPPRRGPDKVSTLPNTNTTYDDPETTNIEQYPVVWPDSMPMSPLGPGSKVYDNVAGTWTLWRTTTMTPSLPEVVADDPNGTDLPAGTDSLIDPNTPKFAKGDLRMRASAVYHYANSGYKQGDTPQQTPFACVSSYYDPSTALTARNITPLDDVSGDKNLPDTNRPASTKIGSHNGIVYNFPGRPALAGPLTITNGLLTGGDPIYTAQANYVFPDGRFANKPLRDALLKAPGARNLADLAAIDSTACALNILQKPTASNAIPAGAIQEVAFLNGREIKAIDADNTTTTVNEEFTLNSPRPVGNPPTAPAAILTGKYDLPIEERQPLEVRATQLNIKALRQQEFNQVAVPNGPAPAKEYLLPNSGVIYASRDDALRDRSARSADENRDKLVSPTDSLLDPTRKPNGILLIEGESLFRDIAGPVTPTTVADVVREKGLTLVSNLPVYIKGEFNKHSEQEFKTPDLDTTWSNFYSGRGALNPNFACRAGDPRLKDCTTGDNWRPATVLADAITLLSGDYSFGFRNEGDFDLRNNAGAAAVDLRRKQGFYHNNFVTNGLTSGAFLKGGGGKLFSGMGSALTDADYAAPQVNSSYFNNFVTPVQRRGKFPENLMETCIKLPVSECTATDWVVNPTGNPVKRAEDVLSTAYNATNRQTVFQAGTTVDPPISALQRFPRRVAFERSGGNLTGGATPQPYGIDGTTVRPGPGTPKDNSLWFATTATATDKAVNYGQASFPFVVNRNLTDWNDKLLPDLSSTAPPFQPLLMPVLQLQTVGTATASAGPPIVSKVVKDTGWQPRAKATSFHLILGAGDIPSRTLDANNGDSNGGLQNLPRFLESWQINNADIPTDIKGSFIQLNRSAYSTSPYLPILPTTTLKSLFARPTAGSAMDAYTAPATGYRTDVTRLPYFFPPKRDWGFDVGLLSQPPDLFTQRFTTPPRQTQPDEYFREVGSDDKWVQTLMCAEVAAAKGTPAVDPPFKPTTCPPTP
jgi:hypothetical protein